MKAELEDLVSLWRRRGLLAACEQWHQEARVVRQCADELERLLARAEDPEQAARERLGRWLESNSGWFHRKGQYMREDIWFCDLVQSHCAGGYKAHGATLAEAINAAIDRAEGKEPTT